MLIIQHVPAATDDSIFQHRAAIESVLAAEGNCGRGDQFAPARDDGVLSLSAGGVARWRPPRRPPPATGRSAGRTRVSKSPQNRSRPCGISENRLVPPPFRPDGGCELLVR